MKEFEITFTGLPKCLVGSLEIPTYNLRAGESATYQLAEGVELKASREPCATMTIECPISPEEDAFLKSWMELLPKREVDLQIDFQESNQNPILPFLRNWNDSVNAEKEKRGYSFSTVFTPEPKLLVPYKLEYAPQSVAVVGSDGQRFYHDGLSAYVFRSSRQARLWAKEKLRTQDFQIVGRIGGLQGMTLHTGLPRIADLIPANLADVCVTSQEERLNSLKEFCDANPNLEWKTPTFDLSKRHEASGVNQLRMYEQAFGTSILKKDNAIIQIKPGT